MKRSLMRIAAAAFAAVLAVSVLALAGCGGGDGGSSSGGSSSGSSSSGSSASGTTAPQERGASYVITDKRVATWKDSIGSNWVQVIVEITNDGTKNLYLGSGTVDLEDASGKLIKSISLVSEYPEVLAPGEKGYMYEETILDEPVEGEINVVPRPDVREAKVPCIRFAVSDFTISDYKYGGIKIMGRVENTSNETESWVYVVAFLYDADGKLIARVRTSVMEELKPGDKIGFETTESSLPGTVTADTVASYIVYAYPEQMQF